MTQLSGARAAAQLAQAVMLRLHGAGRTDLLAGEFAAPPGREQAELCTGHRRPRRRKLRPAPCGMGPARRGPRPAAPARRLSIVQPDPDTHVWRNPEAPPALNRLVLRATVEPPVPQIVWLVDGKPVATAAPDTPLLWPMSPGHHRFQIRLPLEEGVSRPVAVLVE